MIDNELMMDLKTPVKFIYKGKTIFGYPAETLTKLCKVLTVASGKGLLKSDLQVRMGHQATLLLGAFAEVGLTALIDEATGYEKIKDKDALQKILNKYLADHQRKWSKTFPDEFWEKLLRVKGYESYIGLGTPQFVGHWINDIIYDRLAPGIKGRLKELNPRISKHGRRHKHHQFLTEDHGVPELKTHLIKVMTLMEASGYKNGEFEKLINRTLPKLNETYQLPLDD